MPATLQNKSQSCPNCHSNIPVYTNYVSWCECGWNLNPKEPDTPKNRYEELYLSISNQLGKRLFEEMLYDQNPKQSLTWGNLAAYCIAAIVHLSTVAIFGLAIYWTLWGWSYSFFLGLLGILMAFISWILRPRINRMPKNIQLLARDEYPILYQLSDDICRQMNCSKIDYISINEEFNGWIAEIGLRRRKLMNLGLPFLKIHSTQEIIALISHEIAHHANHDMKRTRFLQTANYMLIRWYDMVDPEKDWFRDYGDRIVGGLQTGNRLMFVFQHVNKFIMKLISYLPQIGIYILTHLLWHESQRAEYLADRQAAEISGTQAVLSGNQKIYYYSTVQTAIQRHVLNRSKIPLFSEIDQAVKDIPERELERIARVERLEGTKIHSTHPPTAFRIQMLENYRYEYPKITLSALSEEQLKQELSQMDTVIEQKLIDQIIATLR